MYTSFKLIGTLVKNQLNVAFSEASIVLPKYGVVKEIILLNDERLPCSILTTVSGIITFVAELNTCICKQSIEHC